MKRFKNGDVIRYRPYSQHCHEGLAIARRDDGDKLRYFDTFWGSTPTEKLREDLVNAELVFNLNDYREVKHWEWLKYGLDDRKIVTGQHSLTKIYYVRTEASESLEQQISQARDAVEKKKSELDSAISYLQWAWQDLMRLEAKRDK